MQVIVHSDAYIKFLRFVLEHALPTRPRSSWQETIGFLFGKFPDSTSSDTLIEKEPTEVYITDVLPMDSGSSVYVKVGDYSSIYPVLNEKMEKGEFIVGWIHSHPGLDIFLSGTDISTQLLYQQIDPRSVAIVVDPTKIRQNFPGLKAFRVDSHSYYQISLEIPDITNFTDIHKKIVSELTQRFIPAGWAEKYSITLDNITFNLKVSKGNTFLDFFTILLEYSSKEPGIIYIQYKPELKGGKLLRPIIITYYFHQIYDVGNIAIFGIKPDPKLSAEATLSFKLADFKIFAKDGKIHTIKDMYLIIT